MLSCSLVTHATPMIHLLGGEKECGTKVRDCFEKRDIACLDGTLCSQICRIIHIDDTQPAAPRIRGGRVSPASVISAANPGVCGALQSCSRRGPSCVCSPGPSSGPPGSPADGERKDRE